MALSGTKAPRRGEAETPSAMPIEANGHFAVEACSPADAALHAQAWADLASRCLEPNAFMEPGFCIAAARHLAPPRLLVFVMVWAFRVDGTRELIAVCPILRPRSPLWRMTRVWFHDLAALGVPLLDRDRAGPAFLAVLVWVEKHRAGCDALMLSALRAAGPFARLLAELAERTGRPLHVFDRGQRAILGHHDDAGPAGLAALPRRRAKELARQRRRLSELGGLRYASAVDPPTVSAALERFLDLEARGWKGARGTALGINPSRAAFVRAMTAEMAAAGQCRIDALLLDDVPIAMGIVLSSGNRDFFWKTAYAEEHGALSPGVQFVLDLTRAQSRKPGLRETDSCATPDHPMIDRLWPGRLAIVDMLIALAPGRRRRFRTMLALETLRQNARATLKRLYVGAVAWHGRGR